MKNRVQVFLLFMIQMVAPATSHAQAAAKQYWNTPLSSSQFRQLANKCAPDIPLVTLRALVRAESGFRPYAVSLDYPRRTAREQGLTDAIILLARQPKNLAEARSWTYWFLKRNRSVSIGLSQISTRNVASLGMRIDQLFDPCTNLQASSQLLRKEYLDARVTLGDGQTALLYALSLYNSGSGRIGFENGYVTHVVNGEFTHNVAEKDPGHSGQQ
jgi:type IV secretion system protein VirB1